MDIGKFASKEGILQVKDLKEDAVKKFIDFSLDIPKIIHFFGRKEEMKKLKRWIAEENKHNIIFIHGIAGIGKTTLATKLIEKYRGSRHIFWYTFHTMDTLRGVLSQLADFLLKTGNDNLYFRLNVRSHWDIQENYHALNSDLQKLDAIIVFDDFHKTRDEIREFFRYILRTMSRPTKVKILVLARTRVPFYDRRDVLTREILCELLLEGLDFDSSKKLLEGKGVEKEKIEEIYEATAGNPLFLEIFDSEGEIEKYVQEETFDCKRTV